MTNPELRINLRENVRNQDNYTDLHSEQQWIADAKRNANGFRPLYDRYYDEIYRFIYRRTGSPELTDDICSETFYKALANIRKFEFRGKPFVSWLYIIAGNEVRKHYRRKRPVFILEIDRLQEEIEIPGRRDDSEYEDLIWVLNHINDDDLQLIELRFFEKKTFKELGLMRNMSESGVKMKLYRLLIAMKKLIDKKNDKI